MGKITIKPPKKSVREKVRERSIRATNRAINLSNRRPLLQVSYGTPERNLLMRRLSDQMEAERIETHEVRHETRIAKLTLEVYKATFAHEMKSKVKL